MIERKVNLERVRESKAWSTCSERERENVQINLLHAIKMSKISNVGKEKKSSQRKLWNVDDDDGDEQNNNKMKKWFEIMVG